MDPKFVCKTRINLSWIDRATIQKLDPTRCFIFNSAVFIFDIHLPSITMGLLILIMIISIFGGIKGNYRWFIFNQAIWDFVTCYYGQCSPVVYTLDDKYEGSCFYKDWYPPLMYFLAECISSNTYSALFLLTFTRFICLYFMNFYEKLTSKRRIFYLLFIFNALNIFTNLQQLFQYFRGQRMEYNRNFIKDSDGLVNEFWYRVLEIFDNSFYAFSWIKPVIFLLASVIASICIIAKIVKQFRFQFSQNRKDFLGSARIAFVLCFQTLINLIIALLMIIYHRNKIDEIFPFLKGFTDFIFTKIIPQWISGVYGLSRSSIMEAIVEVRIFIEAVLVLLVMAGYREAILKVVKYFWKLTTSKFLKPKIITNLPNAHRNNISSITLY